MNNIKGAIFDLDGTLLDSMGLWDKVDKDFFLIRNMEVPENYIKTISPLGAENAAIYTKKTYGIKESVEEILKEWITAAEIEYTENVDLKPNAAEYLRFLSSKNVKLSVATASEKKMFEGSLKRHGIYDLFDSFTTVSEVSRGKGFPDVYLLAAERMGVKPEECIVFEDILSGLTAAKSGGFKCVGMFDKCSADDEEKMKKIADKYIYDFKEMM